MDWSRKKKEKEVEIDKKQLKRSGLPCLFFTRRVYLVNLTPSLHPRLQVVCSFIQTPNLSGTPTSHFGPQLHT